MAGSTSSSLFRVGDNVQVWRVVLMISAIVFWVVIFEYGIHKLQHRLHKYPKYHEMLTKVFGELMILGLIGFGLKIMKEVGDMDPYSPHAIAFQAADLTIFILAIGLVIQAASIFLRLRRKNVQVDKAELISTEHLVERIENLYGKGPWYRGPSLPCASGSKKQITRQDVAEVAKMRVLRHLFLTTHGLPELFPFSKYLRQAQDNQISHMIEVKVLMWAILLLVAWGLEAFASLIDDYVDDGDEKFGIVTAFLVFSWLCVLLHMFVCIYFAKSVKRLLSLTMGGSQSLSRLERLRQLAQMESTNVRFEHEHAADVVATMERVRERELAKKAHRGRLCLRRKPSPDDPASEPSSVILLPYFSRSAWHFCVILLLMLNAFFFALFCQCVLYQMRKIQRKAGYVSMCVVPLPLLVNLFVFQPRMFRDFVLVSSIESVGGAALGEVIDHFTETVQLRADFVHTVHAHLRQNQQTLNAIESELARRDRGRCGLLEVDEVRTVLGKFGFQLSFFRFNSVAKLLFDLRGTKIEYSQVIRLLKIGEAGRSHEADVLRLEEATAKPGACTRQQSLPSEMPGHETLRRTNTTVAQSLYRVDFDTRQSGDIRDSENPDGVNYLRM